MLDNIALNILLYFVLLKINISNYLDASLIIEDKLYQSNTNIIAVKKLFKVIKFKKQSFIYCMQNPHLKNIIIAPPFGRYLKFKETSNVYGSFTLERRKGLIKQCIKTIRKIDKNA